MEQSASQNIGMGLIRERSRLFWHSMFSVGCSMFDVPPFFQILPLATCHPSPAGAHSLPQRPKFMGEKLQNLKPHEAESVLRGWQNGKSGFNASRSRSGLPPLTFAVSAFHPARLCRICVNTQD